MHGIRLEVEGNTLYTGGGQKVCTTRPVLPVADNIFKWMFFACFAWYWVFT